MNTALPPRRSLAGLSLVAQIALIGGGLLMVETAARGERAELLIPITPGARTAMPALALDGHSRLIGAGVLPGSLIVRREDAAHPSLLAHGILAIGVPLSVCGEGAAA